MTTADGEGRSAQVANTVRLERWWNVLRKCNLEEIYDSESTVTNNRLSATGAKYRCRWSWNWFDIGNPWCRSRTCSHYRRRLDYSFACLVSAPWGRLQSLERSQYGHGATEWRKEEATHLSRYKGYVLPLVTLRSRFNGNHATDNSAWIIGFPRQPDHDGKPLCTLWLSQRHLRKDEWDSFDAVLYVFHLVEYNQTHREWDSCDPSVFYGISKSTAKSTQSRL